MTTKDDPEVIVKVQRPLYGGKHPREVMVYAEGRERARVMIATPRVIKDMGRDMRAFFRASWVDQQWAIGARVRDQGW